MHWVLCSLILLIVAVVLRRILRLDTQEADGAWGFAPIRSELNALYEPVALEVETQSAILAISLNEAIEERQAGRRENAGRLIALSASEWDRLAEIVALLLEAMGKHLPLAHVAGPVRALGAHRFHSSSMINFARLDEFLGQLVFRARLRFQIRLGVLRRAAEVLTAEFHRAHREADRSLDLPPQVWHRLDTTYHDFDAVAKEVLLSFRSFLSCLSPTALADFTAEIEPIFVHPVRSARLPSLH